MGLDIDWISSKNKFEFKNILSNIEEIFIRWALLGIPTVGCLTGHCIAGGAVFASVMDFRIMRTDRGWFAFNEIDIKIPEIKMLILDVDGTMTDNGIYIDENGVESKRYNAKDGVGIYELI